MLSCCCFVIFYFCQVIFSNTNTLWVQQTLCCVWILMVCFAQSCYLYQFSYYFITGCCNKKVRKIVESIKTSTIQSSKHANIVRSDVLHLEIGDFSNCNINYDQNNYNQNLNNSKDILQRKLIRLYNHYKQDVCCWWLIWMPITCVTFYGLIKQNLAQTGIVNSDSNVGSINMYNKNVTDYIQVTFTVFIFYWIFVYCYLPWQIHLNVDGHFYSAVNSIIRHNSDNNQGDNQTPHKDTCCLKFESFCLGLLFPTCDQCKNQLFRTTTCSNNSMIMVKSEHDDNEIKNNSGDDHDVNLNVNICDAGIYIGYNSFIGRCLNPCQTFIVLSLISAIIIPATMIGILIIFIFIGIEFNMIWFFIAWYIMLLWRTVYELLKFPGVHKSSKQFEAFLTQLIILALNHNYNDHAIAGGTINVNVDTDKENQRKKHKNCKSCLVSMKTYIQQVWSKHNFLLSHLIVIFNSIFTILGVLYKVHTFFGKNNINLDWITSPDALFNATVSEVAELGYTLFGIFAIIISMIVIQISIFSIVSNHLNKKSHNGGINIPKYCMCLYCALTWKWWGGFSCCIWATYIISCCGCNDTSITKEAEKECGKIFADHYICTTNHIANDSHFRAITYFKMILLYNKIILILWTIFDTQHSFSNSATTNDIFDFIYEILALLTVTVIAFMTFTKKKNILSNKFNTNIFIFVI